MPTQWTPEQANEWYRQQPWLVGCNYAPRTAINQLEMWQADTFDPKTIDQELNWAAGIGMNTIRLFLHDLVWFDDARGYRGRIDKVLGIAARHGINAMVVFFDSVWHPFPYLGKQRAPEPGVHNSGWVQSPGLAVLRDEKAFDQRRAYVRDIVGHFRDDDRVVIWDLWNEPDNSNPMSYGPRDAGAEKVPLSEKYLPRVFEWARSARPTQPLTSGVWAGDWFGHNTLKMHETLQLENSDVITFHSYERAEQVETRVAHLQKLGRPMLCTEFMSRGSGSTFQTVLPVLKKHNVGAYCWGLVAGKTQTNYPWDSWQRPYAKEPKLWFHEVFHPDGRPYKPAETKLIAKLTGRGGTVGGVVRGGRKKSRR